MDISSILDPLNATQREVVSLPAGNILVLAGAGSGKTRVLVHRIAWCIQTQQISPFGILAVTFTNKAAAEMRSRIANLLDLPTSSMWVGTFHGIAHRILRTHWQAAGLPQNFSILDNDDQYRAIKRLLRTMELDEAQFPPREIQWFINKQKENGLRAQHLEDNSDHRLHQRIEIYQSYQTFCNNSGLVDFAELLLRIHELFRDQEPLLQQYQERFRYLLVDEFQDTNALQYAWLRLLVGNEGSLFAVGDDDQSIYSWRGAQVENMHQFSKDFRDTKLCRLEQNYRSTNNILEAANVLIAHNSDRLGKKLWTADDGGDRISLYTAYNERDEASYVIEQIHAYPGKYSDNVILYRVGAQSRVIEGTLMRMNIPYRVYGGMRFYERAEIKDVLAYLRLAIFHKDDISFERIINTPTRGIGQRTISELRELARNQNYSLWQAAEAILHNQTLAARAHNALSSFLTLIEKIAQHSRGLPLHEIVVNVIQSSGLKEHHLKEKGERGQARVENMEELITAAKEFETEDHDLQPLQEFLAHTALESGINQADVAVDCVHLMTLHSAKGLEFTNVYLVGMEEGLFPHNRSMDDTAQLEEERRLCYVGITRAKQKLTLSYAQCRNLYGSDHYPKPSRFIKELPVELIEKVRMDGTVEALPTSLPQNDTLTLASQHYTLGQRVQHETFGIGVIAHLEGTGPDTRIRVNFEQKGATWLLAKYANLQFVAD